MTQMQSFNLVDPFHKQSILALNPRTFRNSKDAVKSNDLEAIHQLMNSMALQNSGKLYEEAKSIINSGSELLNTKEIEANTKENKKPKENTILEPSLQTENLQDPEDFFAAVEKLENAKKELNRQKALEDLNETRISNTTREHRPAIPRRKSSYKDYVNSSQSQNDMNPMENEEPRENRLSLARKRAKFSLKPNTSLAANFVEPTLDMEHLQDPEDFFAAVDKFENAKREINRLRGRDDLNEIKFPTTARERRPELPRRKAVYTHHVFSSKPQNNISLSKKELKVNTESQPTENSQEESIQVEKPGSVTKADETDKLVDELMSKNVDGLDENGIFSYLKDRLNIKTLEINDLQLPEIPSMKNLMKTHTLSPVTNDFSNSLMGKTLGKQKKLSENQNHLLSLSSPEQQPKSPFLGISAIGKHLSKSVEPNDLFSAHNADLFPATTSGGPSDDVSKEKEFLVSGSFDFLVNNKISRTPVHNVSQKISDEDLNNICETDNLSEPIISVEDREQCIKENVTAEDTVQKAASPEISNLNVEDITDHPQNVDDVTEKVGPTLPEVNDEVSTMQELESHNFHSAQTDANDIENLDASIPAHIPDIIPQQQNEEQGHPKKSVNNRKKMISARKVDLKKRRQSLAEAGTCFVSGVRRSNRIKRKPLQYWKGERLLYGRVHNSLPTVIGVKYLSPSSENFKVESFVSDKYKELVELTALH